MVAPWILKLLGLAILFYGGIYFNVKYAMGKEIPALINMLIFAFLLILIITQLILYRVRFGKYTYKFYTNRIDYEGKKPLTFMFTDFQQAEVKQHLFDKFFGTGIIKLSKTFSIGPISNVNQIKAYLEQLVRYYLYSQQRFKAQQQQAAMQKEVGQQPGQAQQTAAAPATATTSQQPSQSQPAAAQQPAAQPTTQSQTNNTGM
jgi:hypothetical protein